MKKLLLTVALLAVAAAVIILPLGCQAPAKVVQAQYATVTRGDLSTDITASGNLAYLLTQDVSFDVAGTTDSPVTIKEVLVKVGQTVSKGQALVKADDSVLKTQVADAEVAFKQAQLSFTQSQNSYAQQQYALESAKIALDKANRNLTDAQKQATGKTLFTYYPRIFEIDQNLEQALLDIDTYLQQNANGDPVSIDSALNLLRQRISTAEYNASVSYTFAAAEGSVGAAITAYEALVDAQRTAQQNYTNAQKSLDASKGSLDLAQASFDRAKSTYEDKQQLVSKATLYAPFDGFVTAVPVKGGNNVSKGLVACTVADPNRYQASILVSEKDIDKVIVGTTGYVKAETLTGQFPANVTEVSPTASISSGVVNYAVTVEVTQKEPAKTTLSSSGTTIVDQTGKLRHGLTITVTLQTNKRTNVLLVPKSAVTTRNNQSFVTVVQPDGRNQDKPVKAGLSNWQYTEISSGLSEGEKMVLPSTTAAAAGSTPTSTGRSSSSGAVSIPGLTGGPGLPPNR